MGSSPEEKAFAMTSRAGAFHVIARSAATRQSPPDADYGPNEIASLAVAMTLNMRSR
jgi:hypothetical protein